MAVYNQKKGFLFVHIFRTGGSSMRRIFQGREIFGKHGRAVDVKKHFRVNGQEDLWEKAFKFVVVRNPFDWSLSHYFYIKQRKGHRYSRYMQDKGLVSYLQWYRGMIESRDEHGLRSYTTLTDFCCDDTGDLIVDRVLRFENLGNEVARIQKELDVPSLLLRSGNGTVRQKDFRVYYNVESRKLVEEIFAEDLKRFNYSFK